MPEQIVAVMAIKKETKGTIVFEEPEDGSPHVDATGLQLNIYIPKPTYKTQLGSPDKITLMVEPGDQTK